MKRKKFVVNLNNLSGMTNRTKSNNGINHNWKKTI